MRMIRFGAGGPWFHLKAKVVLVCVLVMVDKEFLPFVLVWFEILNHFFASA